MGNCASAPDDDRQSRRMNGPNKAYAKDSVHEISGPRPRPPRLQNLQESTYNVSHSGGTPKLFEHSSRKPSAALSPKVTPVPYADSLQTLQNYGFLCRSAVAQILTHDQLAVFSALAETVRYNPKQPVYHAGDVVNTQGLFFIVEGSCVVSKFVELKELTKGPPESSGGSGQGHGIKLGNGIAPNTAATAAASTVSVSAVPARWTNLNEKLSDSAYEVRLRTIESRQWFGYCTMLNMGIRQSTVTSAEHTIALVWSDAALNEFFSRFPGTSALLRDGIAGQRLMRELTNTSFLTNLQEEHAALLTTLFQSRYIPANTVIFEEGDAPAESSSLFMLVSGSAVMYQAVPGGGQNLVKAIEPGTFFGEACMLFRLPRIGTVRTNHASLVMELSFASFTSFLRYTPYLGVDVKKAFNNNSIASVYLMQNPVILAAFTEFCAAEHSGENVEFFAAAKLFRTSPLRQKALITLDARSIFDKYISDKSERQVNLFSATRDKIAQAIEHTIINKLTFEEAEEEILHLMDRDSFSRFKQSGLFQEALQRCRDKQ